MPCCTECGAEISDEDKFCAECGAQIDLSDDQEDHGPLPVNNVEQLVKEAIDDTVTEERLSEKSGRLVKRLEDQPIIDYLQEDEQPHFMFNGPSTGFELDGEYSGQISPGDPHNAWLVVTDRRLLGLVGQDDGDEVMPIDYEDVDDVELEQSFGKFTLTINAAGTSYTFYATDDNSADTDAALNYIRSNAGLETKEDLQPEAEDDSDGIDRRRALKWGGASVVGLTVIGALAGGDDDSEETLVAMDHWEQRVDTFEAEEDDTILVYVKNDLGFRTHIAIEDPEGIYGEIILSEGVRDEAVYELELEHSGEYTVRMTPDDDSTSSGGSVEVVLIHDE